MPADPHSLMAAGEFLAAHDAALARLAAGEESRALRQIAVLALARAGALGSARRLFASLGLDACGDPEIRGLGARLLKDRALAYGRRGDATAAARASLSMFRQTGDPWHGINTAAMLLLAGRERAASRLAAVVAELPDRGDYWSAATAAEAALLSRDTHRAIHALAVAESRAGGDLAARAATLRQMRWEADRLGLDPAVLAPLRLPAMVHFCGHIPAGPADETPLRAALAPLVTGVGRGFGSLAAGADIVIAEALLAAGAKVTAILPFPAEAFVAASVAPAGEAWVARFHALLPRCETVVLGSERIDDCDFHLASRRAMGLVRLAARALAAPCWQIAVMEGEPAPGVAGTAADVAAWQGAGGISHLLRNPWPRRRAAAVMPAARETKSVLFADLRGFGALDDTALGRFYSAVLPRFAAALAIGAPVYRNAWGDALQAVFDSPADAAAAGAAVAGAVPATVLAAACLPATLRPRLALDFGALARVFDPVQGVAKFAGRVMTRAARIEPVTPPGSIYATEAFACEMALAPEPRFACDYAGIVATAKGFGSLPLYALRPLIAPGGIEEADEP